jgi:hypothetical protein
MESRKKKNSHVAMDVAKSIFKGDCYVSSQQNSAVHLISEYSAPHTHTKSIEEVLSNKLQSIPANWTFSWASTSDWFH